MLSLKTRAVAASLLVIATGCSSDKLSSSGPTELDVRRPVTAKLAPLLSKRATPPDSDARYIVMLKDDVAKPKERARALATRHGKATHHVFEHSLKGFAATITPAEVAILQASPEVAYIEEDRQAFVGAVDNTPGWGLDRIDQRTLPRNGQFSSSYDGTGVTMYVVDTGVEASHPDFGGRVIAGWTSDATYPSTTPCWYHGTAVAGVAAGGEYGVAKNATIVAVKGSNECANWGWVSSWTAGVDWVTGHHTSGPAVLNMSVSSSNFLDNILPGSMNDAVKRAKADGIFVVVSAGNDNEAACNKAPANAREVVTVGSTDDVDRKSSFSNWGDCVDLFAPGENINVPKLFGTYGYSSGTSFSTPFVAGVGALLLQRFPNDPPERIRNMIVNGGSHVVTFPGGNGGASPDVLLFSNVPSVPTVVISGPENIGWSNSNCRWEAVITGGRDPYTFQWSGLKSGTNQSIMGPIYQSGAFELQIWDALGQSATAGSVVVNMNPFDPGYTWCSGGAE
ncbi:S8 family peptidase [Gemmatimonas sp.]|uniref:S8 family peptidase n=1 Tax=Gemmatimonas sp. TaxID=1962908 RepID=UPI00286C6DF2|nr:S8 family peptidase [Gemmatimonas sp.]